MTWSEVNVIYSEDNGTKADVNAILTDEYVTLSSAFVTKPDNLDAREVRALQNREKYWRILGNGSKL